MEDTGADIIHGQEQNRSQNVAELVRSEIVAHPTVSAEGNRQGHTMCPRNRWDVTQQEVPGGNPTLGDMNMEATATSNDVIKAGGLGARDNLNSLVPVASDLTDYKASLNYAREHEEPQGIDRTQGYAVKPKNGLDDAAQEQVRGRNHILGEVNMEATITSDDVMRAGGFGARDDLNSFLPVASDLTDFEASLNDARGYEESQGVLSRPGLGWTGKAESE